MSADVPNDDDLPLTPKEFAALTRRGIATIRRYLARGRLPKAQPGGKGCGIRIPRSALTSFLQQSENAPSVDAEHHSNPKGSIRRGPRPKWQARGCDQ